jgi:hypothetical protein
VVCNGTGELAPLCDVAPNPLDFEGVIVGEFADLTFTIFNLGGGVLSGTVSETCDDFSITSGGGAYNLGAGEFVDVTVRFEPTSVGPKNCSIETGTACVNVSCLGTGVEPPPECQIEPPSLAFGLVDVGNAVDQVFRITNIGGGLLEGDVTEACDDYSLIGGAGPFSLAAGEFVDVNVRFQPTSGGLKECTVETGTECADVPCTGTGVEEAPACQIVPPSLDFGMVDVGSMSDQVFRITNVGGGLLTGDVSETCDHYSLIGGEGAFSLGAGEFVDVNVRFEPTSIGLKECTVQTGTACADVPCTGTGTDDPPECLVEPSSLDFGSVNVGDAADQVFRITNVGGSVLTGEVSEVCDDFSLIGGAGPFSLGRGEFVDVNVRFAPTSGGLKECTVLTGMACADVPCTGTGVEAPPECQVDPTTLDYGMVNVGSAVDQVFRITNVGGGLLAGEVSEVCDDYSLIGGAGPFSLAAGEFVDVNVRFAPTSIGLKECTVETGTECADVSCTGTGVEGGFAVYFDIKPGSCPNPLNVKSSGVLPAAVLGTENFDVMTIDLTMLRLTLAGMNGGVMPLRSSYEDVGTPFMGALCDCHELEGDGITDLTLKFDTQEVVTGLGLASMPEGDVELTLTGYLVNGEPITGADCVRLKGTNDQPAAQSGGTLGFVSPEGDAEGVGAEIEISFYTERTGHTHLEVFDVRGRTIKTLVDRPLEAGTYTVTWDRTGYSGDKVRTGVYFVRLRQYAESVTEKFVVVN